MRASVRNKNLKRFQKYLRKKQKYTRREQRRGFLKRLILPMPVETMLLKLWKIQII